MNVVYVFVGGGIGSVARFYLSALNINKAEVFWPAGTMLANLLSCFILGILTAKILNDQLHASAALLLITGFCGGFSTFSSFSYELYLFYQKGAILSGMVYIGVSLILGLMLLVLGMKISS
ncbi:MAG TPA: fluoride efflux transporter CrcB [Saprospiraceae bacterium]|jgi:CrcB protein|nr:fluoride efflux transporter CrcB [Saprospiraceae bacterium]HRO08052.1 fluoride efflux transporter CrcB [Saprospiraceae bacterium]HRP41361.1 fluoride efflux transporter CrcB [Saprospiraceae bacterium]